MLLSIRVCSNVFDVCVVVRFSAGNTNKKMSYVARAFKMVTKVRHIAKTGFKNVTINVAMPPAPKMLVYISSYAID